MVFVGKMFGNMEEGIIGWRPSWKGKSSAVDTQGHPRMSLGLWAPISPPPPEDQHQRPLPMGSRYLSASSTRSHCRLPGVACHGAAIQRIRKMGGPLLALGTAPRLSPQTYPAPPLQGQEARWLRSGRYQMYPVVLIPVRPGRAGKGPLACSQAPIVSLGPWFSLPVFSGRQGLMGLGVACQAWPWVSGKDSLACRRYFL